MMKSKGSWNMLLKKLGCRLIPKPSNPKVSKLCRKSKIAPASATELEENAV
ncbi:BTB/POZ domain-containing protein, partial [Trifolium medium]|nr:BTB/POZ domain-containing protein [Trifolium medium]